jgi:hypothetical protein
MKHLTPIEDKLFITQRGNNTVSLSWDNCPGDSKPELVFDYFGRRLQMLVYDSTSEEPALSIKLNDAGEITEVIKHTGTHEL